MPARKRTLQETGANAGVSSPASKNQKRVAEQENRPAEEDDAEGTSDAEDCSPESRKPDEWICMEQPIWDFNYAATHKTDDAGDEQSGEEDEDDGVDSDDLHERYRLEVIDTKIWGKPAAQHPEHKWKIVWDAWMQLCELTVQEDYCNPDNFNMHVYNDFHSYGVVALVEKKLAEFNKEYNKKPSSPDRSSVKHMWATLDALGHWLQLDDRGPLMKATMIDDGDRAAELVALLGCALLTGLDAVERMGWLKPAGSEIQDLGVVMSIYLDWSRDMPEYGIGEEGSELDWRENVVAYAKRAGIDLEKDGCTSAGRLLKEFTEVEALPGPAKVGRWKWSKHFKDYKTAHGINGSGFTPYGLPGYDITKWPRNMRAKWAFDKKDPLADIPEKDLRENNIMVG